ncbi:MAG: hypothetical protein HUU15_00190 [Candidatus Brocadiae bacterium]|nr:hypothetical protein [Candidatus Brocadiia bacterium]
MADAVRHALGRSQGTWNRHDLDVAATVQVGAEFTECRVSALSRQGVLLTPKADFESLRRFHEFFHARVDRGFEGRIAFPGGEEEFHGHAAYAEMAPDSKVRQVALAFDADHDWFSLLAPPAAETPAEPAPAPGV